MADLSTAAAAGTAEPVKPTAAAPKTETSADLRAAYPSLVSEIETSAKLAGAAAERERITGILGLPSAGHAELVSTHIANGKSTKADVALAMVEAEAATRNKRMDNIKGVEEAASPVKPAISAAGAGGNPHSANIEQTPDGWKAEYAASDKLKSEFATADDYVAWKANESKVRILRKG